MNQQQGSRNETELAAATARHQQQQVMMMQQQHQMTSSFIPIQPMIVQQQQHLRHPIQQLQQQQQTMLTNVGTGIKVYNHSAALVPKAISSNLTTAPTTLQPAGTLAATQVSATVSVTPSSSSLSTMTHSTAAPAPVGVSSKQQQLQQPKGNNMNRGNKRERKSPQAVEAKKARGCGAKGRTKTANTTAVASGSAPKTKMKAPPHQPLIGMPHQLCKQQHGPGSTVIVGGVSIPAESLPPNATTAMQVEVAANAAAAAAAPKKNKKKSARTGAGGCVELLDNLLHHDLNHSDSSSELEGMMGTNGSISTSAAQAALNDVISSSNSCDIKRRYVSNPNLTPEERAKQNRDRNREHARSTRLRKKAYMNKLKELVDGLHAERTEEVRKRRVSVQAMAEMQRVRRSVMRTFMGYHAECERDVRKWNLLLEEGSFWCRQPVTPYRSFRRNEIQAECRVIRGVEGMMADAASVGVMVEGMGSRSSRWMHIKREIFLGEEMVGTSGRTNCSNRIRRSPFPTGKAPPPPPPSCVGVGDESSLKSSSNGSNNGNADGEGGCNSSNSGSGNGEHQQQTVSSLSSNSGCEEQIGNRAKSGTNNKKADVSNSGCEANVSNRSDNNNASAPSAQQQDQHNDVSHNVVSSNGSATVIDNSNIIISEKKSMSSKEQQKLKVNNEFHDYHAASLPDPMLDSGEGSAGSDSPIDKDEKEEGEDSANSDIDDIPRTSHLYNAKQQEQQQPMRTMLNNSIIQNHNMAGTNISSNNETRSAEVATEATVTSANHKTIHHSTPASAAVTTGTTNSSTKSRGMIVGGGIKFAGLPANIARSGGISHNIRSVIGNGGGVGKRSSNISLNGRKNLAPAVVLPPFVGIGKKANGSAAVLNSEGPNPVTLSVEGDGGSIAPNNGNCVEGFPPLAVDVFSNSSSSTPPNNSTSHPSTNISQQYPERVPSLSSATTNNNHDSNFRSNNDNKPNNKIQAYYHVNEDDMILTDDVIMFPFIFRSQDALLHGALAECIMPGMLRAKFSSRNKLLSVEMVYDAMGFMQQLERASGSEGSAQIIPNSLEMALCPNISECRCITLSAPPYLVLSVNESWTKLTGYTQTEVEGKSLESLLHGDKTDCFGEWKKGKTNNDNETSMRKSGDYSEVSKGRSICETNVHYDKNGRDFVDFVCSYPLISANNETKHLLHVCKELSAPDIINGPNSSGFTIDFLP